MVAATQKRKMLCKPEEVMSLSLSFIKIHLTAFAGVTKFSRLVTMGDHSPEPVDETMSGNKFHCKNK